MGIKETPTNFRTYYKLMHERTSKKLNDIIEAKDNLEIKNRILHDDILSKHEDYKNVHNIDITHYEEFNENKYINGELYKDARGLFMNRKDNYKLVSELYDLYVYANSQKQIVDYEKEIKHCQKLLALNIKDYTNLLKLYYTEVHKKLVIDGYGYVFGERIGWICINRVVLGKNKRKTIDYKKTKLREAELKAKGIRIYNKEDAEYCKKYGIEYVAEDKRVYRNDEAYYEIPLIDCKLPHAHDLEFKVSDYRHSCLRGKTNEDLIAECNNDKNKICELPIDVKTKVTLCNTVDKILYNKYIRNENQKSVIVRAFNS